MKRLFMLAAMMIAAVALYAQRQDVRSFLKIYDMSTGQSTLVRQFDYHMEAPNWTFDGRELVYNSGGKIYRIPVGGGEPILVPTGEAQSCNNDHVLSSDGRWIAVSSSDRERGFGSRIYIVPFPEGGEARLVTQEAPSYLHGWSPDMKTLAYVARREGHSHLNIYICDAADGGNETRLTFTEGLDDGSEYSPDGKTIWLNSVRTGLMQVWKMDADGSNQTQMTFDPTRNIWFPHISPDGKHVVMIAYKEGDVAPGSHPANRNVEILYMPAEGGTPRSIISFFGGQGSFNVNSWAPDSQRFAYVTYELIAQ